MRCWTRLGSPVSEDRYRVTVRHSGVELRGYIDSRAAVRVLASALEPAGWLVIASPAEDDYDPFRPQVPQ